MHCQRFSLPGCWQTLQQLHFPIIQEGDATVRKQLKGGRCSPWCMRPMQGAAGWGCSQWLAFLASPCSWPGPSTYLHSSPVHQRMPFRKRSHCCRGRSGSTWSQSILGTECSGGCAVLCRVRETARSWGWRVYWGQRGWREPWAMLKFSAMVWRAVVCIKFAQERQRRKRGLGNEEFNRRSFALCGV